jgi:hypothetical protein
MDEGKVGWRRLLHVDLGAWRAYVHLSDTGNANPPGSFLAGALFS